MPGPAGPSAPARGWAIRARRRAASDPRRRRRHPVPCRRRRGGAGTEERSACAWVILSRLPPLPLGYVDEQQGDGGRGDARNALRLADGLGAHALELLLRFGGQAAHLRVIEAVGDARGLVALLARDLLALALEVTGVLDADLDLLGHVGIG